MPYMLLILEPRGQRAERSEDEGRALYGSMLDFGAALQARGKLIAAESLRSAGAGVRVAVRAGRRSRVAGPVAAAKEMVGGFFLVDCATRDEAVAIAAECPAAQWATVEVRGYGACYEDHG